MNEEIIRFIIQLVGGTTFFGGLLWMLHRMRQIDKKFFSKED